MNEFEVTAVKAMSFERYKRAAELVATLERQVQTRARRRALRRLRDMIEMADPNTQRKLELLRPN